MHKILTLTSEITLLHHSAAEKLLGGQREITILLFLLQLKHVHLLPDYISSCSTTLTSISAKSTLGAWKAEYSPPGDCDATTNYLHYTTQLSVLFRQKNNLGNRSIERLPSTFSCGSYFSLAHFSIVAWEGGYDQCHRPLTASNLTVFRQHYITVWLIAMFLIPLAVTLQCWEILTSPVGPEPVWSLCHHWWWQRLQTWVCTGLFVRWVCSCSSMESRILWGTPIICSQEMCKPFLLVQCLLSRH